MENEYVDILGIYPGMHASKFKVQTDSWNHFCDHYLNFPDAGNCFLPCKDADGDVCFVDMTKLLAFYVLKEESKKIGTSRQTDEKIKKPSRKAKYCSKL